MKKGLTLIISLFIVLMASGCETYNGAKEDTTDGAELSKEKAKDGVEWSKDKVNDGAEYIEEKTD